MTHNPDAKKIGWTYVVREETRARSPIDEIQRAEERGLAEVVMKVHAERMVGESWPKVERIPVKWSHGHYLNLTAEEIEGGVTPDEWRIYVSVIAVPR